MNSNEFYQRIAVARSHVEKRMPHIMPMVFRLVTIYQENVPSASVDSRLVMRIGPQVARMRPEILATILAHEGLHPIMGHNAEFIMSYEPMSKYERNLLGIAMDLPINSMLKAAGFTFPTYRDFGYEEAKLPKGRTLDDINGALPEFFGLPEFKSTEWYFEELKRKYPPLYKDGQQVGGSNDPKEKGHNCTESGEGSGSEGEDDSEEGKRAREQSEKLGRDEADIEQAKKEVQSAIEAAKQRGEDTAHADILLQKLLTPPVVDYRKLIRHKVRNAMQWTEGMTHTTYTKRSKRQAGLGSKIGSPIVPSLRSKRPHVGIILDVSGSMIGSPLQMALSEIKGILEKAKADVRLVSVDTELQNDFHATSIEKLIRSLTGGGGSDLSPAFDYLSACKMRNEQQPDLVFCLTDGFCLVPTAEPSYKTIFLLTESMKPEVSGGGSVSWGDCIFLPEKKCKE